VSRVVEVNIEEVGQAVLAAYRRNAGELARTAASVARNPGVAEDAVQETFLRYFLSLAHGEIINDERAWLHRVMRNWLTDWVRSASVRSTMALDDVAEPLAGAPLDQTLTFRLHWLRKAAAALGRRERECIHLRAQGLEYGEIASEMKIRPGTVGALLNSAIRKLRQTLELREELS
jgi:RNA polymerase sigma-70 factor, ECF subfamily